MRELLVPASSGDETPIGVLRFDTGRLDSAWDGGCRPRPPSAPARQEQRT
jgi:hypothetical protein